MDIQFSGAFRYMGGCISGMVGHVIEVFLLNIAFKITYGVIMLFGSRGGGWPIGYMMVDEVEGDTRHHGFSKLWPCHFQ